MHATMTLALTILLGAGVVFNALQVSRIRRDQLRLLRISQRGVHSLEQLSHGRPRRHGRTHTRNERQEYVGK